VLKTGSEPTQIDLAFPLPAPSRGSSTTEEGRTKIGSEIQIPSKALTSGLGFWEGGKDLPLVLGEILIQFPAASSHGALEEEGISEIP